MIDLTSDVEQELLTAMDKYKAIAEELIDKLITETDQPEKEKINAGHYYEIQEVILPFLIDLISRKPKPLSLFKFRWF
ncbi:hypothetical protein OF842_14155, partial [Acinetobacter bereziniae]|nr:hypothetical protein [Acinetobacter bereziniae]